MCILTHAHQRAHNALGQIVLHNIHCILNTVYIIMLYCALCCSSLTAFQLYRTGPDGDRSLQIAEDTATQQRPYLLLSVPDPARAEIHSLCQCSAQRPEAFKPSHQHHL